MAVFEDPQYSPRGAADRDKHQIWCRNVRQALPFALVVFASACAMTEDDQQPTTTMTEDEVRTADHIGVCANDADQVHCHARVLVDPYGAPRANAAPPPSSFNAAQIRSFYGITATGSTTTTVARAPARWPHRPGLADRSI